MRNKIVFSSLPTYIDKGHYCNIYVELALRNHFKDSYVILESIYYIGRWYATRSSLKSYFQIGDVALKRKLDILEEFCLVEFYNVGTPESYVKLTNSGASLIAKKKIQWNSSKSNTALLLEKSKVLYALASLELCDKKFISKFNKRDSILKNIFNPHMFIEAPSVDTLEQSHIYILKIDYNEVVIAVKYVNTEDYFKDTVKAYEFFSKYRDIGDFKINIVLASKNEEEAKNTLIDIKNDDFKKSERNRMISYLSNKHIGIPYEIFLNKISKTTYVLSY